MTTDAPGPSPRQPAAQTRTLLEGITPARAVEATLVVLGVAAAFGLLWQFKGVVFIVFVAIMLHIAIKPALGRLWQKGIRQRAGLILIYMALGVVLAAFLILFAPFLASQLSVILVRLPEYYSELRTGLLNANDAMARNAGSLLPPNLSILTLFAPPEPAPVEPGAAPATPAALQALESVIKVAFAFAAVFIMAFYWTIDGERIVYSLLLRVPAERRDELRALIDEMESKVGAFYRGQLVLCLFVGVLSTAAYILIGLPNALLLGLLALLFEAVPIIGPTLGAIPAVIIAFTVSPDKAIWVVLATIVIQQVENNLLVPRVMDRAVGVNPIVSILSIIGLSVPFGLLGALLAIPLAAIVQVMLNHWLFQTVPASAQAPIATATSAPDELQVSGRRDRATVLRMEARELAKDVRKQLRDPSAAEDLQQGDEHVNDLIEAIALDLDALLTPPDEANAGQVSAGVAQL